MSRMTRMMWLGLALVVNLTIVLVSVPSSPITLVPKASTGVFLTGCAYDSDGNILGCSYSQKAPLGQSIITGFGGSIDSVKIPSAYLKVNYTGQTASWTFTATELIQYDKGVSATYPITISGTGNPSKVINLTLPKSEWASPELQSKFTGYGQKLVNASITNCSWTFIFANSIKLVKPCAYNYFVQFKINYEQDITTTTTTTTTSPTITQTTTVTQTSTTTISGEGISSGTTDAWTTTVTSASSGSGNTAMSGIIVDIQPYLVGSGFAIAWVYIPSGYSLPSCESGTCGQVTIVTKATSVGVFGLSFQAGRWTQASIPVGVSAGDLVLAQIFYSNQQIYNQAIAVSQPTTLPELGASQVPASPYTSQWQTQSCASGAITEGTCAVWFPSLYETQTTTTVTTSASSTLCGLEKLGGEITKTYCSLSIVSVTF